SGTTRSSGTPAFGTNYGDVVPDDPSNMNSTLTWVCVGPPVAWVAGSATTGIWNLPLAGFTPPQNTSSFGGSSVIGTSNDTVQAVTVSGTSGSGSEPTWAAPPSPTNIVVDTTDNTITWYAESYASPNSLAW